MASIGAKLGCRSRLASLPSFGPAPRASSAEQVTLLHRAIDRPGPCRQVSARPASRQPSDSARVCTMPGPLIERVDRALMSCRSSPQ